MILIEASNGEETVFKVTVFPNCLRNVILTINKTMANNLKV